MAPSAWGDLDWGWVALAVVAEIVSVVSLGALYRPLLRAGGITVSVRRGTGLGAVASAITASLPAGTAVSSGYLFRQFRRAGGNSALAAWAVLVTAGLSLVGFAAVVGSGAALGSADWLESVWQIAGIGLASAAFVVVAATTFTRYPAALIRIVGPIYRRLPGRRVDRAAREANLARTVDQLAAIRPGPRLWLLALGYAALTWAGDLATFLLSLHAAGIHLGIGAASLAYGAGLATTSISLLPAGIGAVEAGMLVGLTSAGVAGSVALAGIVTYRVVAYVLVASAGWVVWAGLRRADRHRPVRGPALAGPGAPRADARTGSLAA